MYVLVYFVPVCTITRVFYLFSAQRIAPPSLPPLCLQATLTRRQRGKSRLVCAHDGWAYIPKKQAKNVGCLLVPGLYLKIPDITQALFVYLVKQEPVHVLDAHARIVQGFRENLWHLRPGKKKNEWGKKSDRCGGARKKNRKSKEEGLENSIGTWVQVAEKSFRTTQGASREAGQQSLPGTNNNATYSDCLC